MSFMSVDRRPAYELVADQIREAILSRELESDAVLPPERELAAKFGVGRTTVREALRVLEAQGLVVSGGPTAPFRVAAPESVTAGPFQNALGQLLRMGRIPLRDLVEVRAALESAAVWHATKRKGDLSAARAELEAMRGGDIEPDLYLEADVRFHLALAEASGNAALGMMMFAVRASMADHLLEALQHVPDLPGVQRRLAREHADIVDAIDRQDAELAATLVRTHIVGFYEHLYEHSPEGGAGADQDGVG